MKPRQVCLSVAKHIAYVRPMIPLDIVGGNDAAETRFQMHVAETRFQIHVAETRVQLCIVILCNGLAWHKSNPRLKLESGCMVAYSFVLYLQYMCWSYETTV